MTDREICAALLRRIKKLSSDDYADESGVFQSGYDQAVSDVLNAIDEFFYERGVQ